jgi:hypothetical protein
MRTRLLIATFLAIIFVVLLVSVPSAAAHTHRVVTINGQKVEFVVGWIVEPPYVGEINHVDFWAHNINATCPQGTVSTSCPVYGLDQSLQVQVITGGQSQTLTFSPNLSNDVPPLFYGEYTADIEPTVAGSYSFRIFGTVQGTPVNETFTCGPDTFECVNPPSTVQFPQQIPSGHDMQIGLSNMQSQVAQMQSNIQTAYAIAVVGVVVGIIGIVLAGVAITRSKRKR